MPKNGKTNNTDKKYKFIVCVPECEPCRRHFVGWLGRLKAHLAVGAAQDHAVLALAAAAVGALLEQVMGWGANKRHLQRGMC